MKLKKIGAMVTVMMDKQEAGIYKSKDLMLMA